MSETDAIRRLEVARKELLAERERLLSRVREINAALAATPVHSKRHAHGSKRDSVRSYLLTNPGASMAELLAAMPDGACNANRSSLTMMVHEGIIRRVGEPRHGKYYLVDGDSK